MPEPDDSAARRDTPNEIPDEQFRLLAENQPVLCWIADADGHVRWFNRRWYDYTGSSPAEMEGWGWKSVHDPRTVEDVTERWIASLATGEPFEMTLPLRGAFGEFRPFLTLAQPVRDALGRITCWCGNNVDVSRQYAVETALADRETQLKNLLATLDLSAVIIRRMDGTIQFWLAGFERLYGWSAAEAVGRNSHQLLQTIFPVPLAEIEATLLRDGEWSGDLRHKRRDGSEIIVAARKVLQRDAEGNPLAIMESVADVTALRRAEGELRILNADLQARVRQEVRERETAQARLAQAEKLSALGQLAGGVAHDFNNVIQAVSGSASLIQRHALDPNKVTRYARMMEDVAARGAFITRRLLAFARRGELRAEPTQIGAVVEGVREVLTHTIGAAVTVRVDVMRGLPLAMVDRSQLETTLINLAANARDAFVGDGVITFTAIAETVLAHDDRGLAPGDYIRLSVADTGAGMDKKTLRRALEPFFTTKEKGKGTGLGLSMARGFAEQSGGALHVESAPGEGTTVTLWLPETTADGRVQVAREAAATTPRVPRRILLVDDDEPVMEVLAGELEDHGYAVFPAASGEAALAMLEAGEKLDLVVSDFSMPGMDGLSLIREAQRLRPGLPAILLTGYAAEAETLFGEHPGDATFSLLRKPVSGALLADNIAVLVQSAEMPLGL